MTERFNAEAEHIPDIARMLARAFLDDPLWRWLAIDDERYEERVARGFELQLRYLALPSGLIHTADGIPGAAIWSPPGNWQLSLGIQLRFLHKMLPICGIRALPSRLLAIRKVQEHHPKELHWYLQVLGVDPAHQGKGWASRLLSPTLAVCDHQQSPAWLETCNPDNIPLYRRFGFEVTLEITLPYGGPQLWGMWRNPGPPPDLSKPPQQA